MIIWYQFVLIMRNGIDHALTGNFGIMAVPKVLQIFERRRSKFTKWFSKVARKSSRCLLYFSPYQRTLFFTVPRLLSIWYPTKMSDVFFLDYFCSLLNSKINVDDFDLLEGVTKNIFLHKFLIKQSILCVNNVYNISSKNKCLLCNSIIKSSYSSYASFVCYNFSVLSWNILKQSCSKSEKLPEMGKVAKHLRNSPILNNSNYLKYISKGLLSNCHKECFLKQSWSCQAKL